MAFGFKRGRPSKEDKLRHEQEKVAAKKEYEEIERKLRMPKQKVIQVINEPEDEETANEEKDPAEEDDESPEAEEATPVAEIEEDNADEEEEPTPSKRVPTKTPSKEAVMTEDQFMALWANEQISLLRETRDLQKITEPPT